ncbi:MAG: single-stranded-DNA-specific exonuclease RecJ [Candidatus Margulisiibacteriota bacterium]
MKKWITREKPPEHLIDQVCLQFNISRLLATILHSRGMIALEKIQKYLSPKLGNLSDPFLIPGMDQAAKRILMAKENGERVLVYGDYDVDGVTATAILLKTFQLLGLDATYYIPHRYEEGYGLSNEAIEKIAEDNIDLIVTVDCGISSFEEISYANDLGMEVVVTDHHTIPEKMPPACAIVNPKVMEKGNPSRELAGAGVAFKFAWAILKLAGVKDSTFLASLLDLAALGTIADVVPLTEENRILASAGLKLINERKRAGIKALAESASIKGDIGITQINFGIAPRINAAGRLEHASKSLELLLTDEFEAAKLMASELNRINVRRQETGLEIKQEILLKIVEEGVGENKVILLIGKAWHPGVIGIVASQIVDAYSRPVVLVGVDDGVGRGSARSVDGVNVYDLLFSCKDLFNDFGGHAGAAGFEIKEENIVHLKKRLNQFANDTISLDDLSPIIKIDMEIDPSIINLNLIKELQILAPFGEKNREPVFMALGLTLTDVKLVGKDKHAKMNFSIGTNRLEAIGFGMGGQAGELKIGNKYDIAFNLESNVWNGFEKVQLSLIDIKEAAV